MNDPLEQNLARLLTRAYRPVRPGAEFTEDLLARVLARPFEADDRSRTGMETGAPHRRAAGESEVEAVSAATGREPAREPEVARGPRGSGAARLRLIRPLLQGLAAAALVLVAVGAWLRWAPGGLRSAADWNGLGRSAIRLDDGPWFAAPDGPLPWLTRRIEAQVAEAAHLEIVSLSGDRLALGPGAHARLSTGPEGPVLRALAGGMQLDKAPHSPRWCVEEGAGADPGLRWDEGLLTVSVEDGADSSGAPEREALAPLDAGDRVALSADSADTGSPLAPGGAETPASARDRSVVDEAGDGAPGGARPGEVVLRGRLRWPPGAAHGLGMDGSTGDPSPELFRVWTRPLVDLPEVSEPTCHRVRVAGSGTVLGAGEAAAQWSPAAHGDGGEFTLRGLAPGAYAVHVEVPGYAGWHRDPVRLDSASDAILDVELEEGATLRGFVLDARTQTPVVGALVLATEDLPHQLVAMHGFRPEPMPRAHAFTDGNGAFELSHVSSGPTHLRASHPDFAIGWQRLTGLASGGELDVGAIELGQGGSVEGRVERRTGGALPNAMVVASRIDGTESISKQHFGAAATGPDGSYRIDHLAEGAYVVINVAGDLGGESEWGLLQQIVIRDGRTERVDFLAEASERRVSGRVVDAHGRSLAGWVLTLTDSDGSEGFVDWVASGLGPGGRFEFTGVRPGLHGLYLGRHANRSFLRCEVLEVPGDGGREVLVQLPDTRLSGQLLDGRSGLPASGYVLVECLDRETGSWDFAARDMESDGGAFDFPYLAPGRYRITGSNAAGLAPGRSEPFELTPGVPSRVELAMPPAGRILVECADAWGRPVRGARLVLSSADGDGLLNLGFGEEPPLSDFNGHIERGHLPLATLAARLSAPGFLPAEASLTPTEDGTLWRVVLQADER